MHTNKLLLYPNSVYIAPSDVTAKSSVCHNCVHQPISCNTQVTHTHARTHVHTHTHTHTHTHNRLMALCPGLTGRAGTRRNIHPLTPMRKKKDSCRQQGLLWASEVFADDAKIYRHIQCHEDCKLLQYALARLQSWSQKWLLGLNTEKCCVVSYGKNIMYTVSQLKWDKNWNQFNYYLPETSIQF